MKFQAGIFVFILSCWLQLHLGSAHCHEKTYDSRKYYDWHYIPREFWGARQPKSIEHLNGSNINHIFIHHTQGPRCNESETCYRILRGIQNFHMDERGWDDIGYNFLVDDTGELYEGRSWERVGAHTKGFNNVSVAFALLGDFRNETPPHDMLETTQCMIKELKQTYGSGRDIKVHGHRDAGCTDCPGDGLYEIIRNWPDFQEGPLPGYRRCG